MLPTEEARVANRARFARLVARPEPEIDLALGALLIAADGRPDLTFEPTPDALDRLPARTRIRLDRVDAPADRPPRDPHEGPAQPAGRATGRPGLDRGAGRRRAPVGDRAGQPRPWPRPGRPPRPDGPVQRGDPAPRWLPRGATRRLR